MVKIFGVYEEESTKRHNEELLIKMFKSFEFGHVNYKIIKEYGVGHIKIETLNRKRIASSKNITVCFSGQLFEHQKNQKTKKETDEKYILNEYLKSGLNFVKRLNGVFVFSIYDKKKNKVYLINDRYGMKPIYYYADTKK